MPLEELSDEEVGVIMAYRHPALSVPEFIERYLSMVDMDRFDSDNGHIDEPIAVLRAALSYKSAGGSLTTR